MNTRMVVAVCVVVAITFFIIPSALGETTLTDDEKAFLSDILGTGIPMLYQTPEAMNTGVFFGTDTAIADIASKKSEELTKLNEKISGYTLGTETSALRDSWNTASETLKTRLEEYSGLNSGCGSCVTAMNTMYPLLIESAGKVNRDLISFYEKNQITL